jgi:hypothetical protein
MIIPELYGSLATNNFFIYTAADEKYFDNFALPIIKSIKQNTDHSLHLHIFNPRQDQIDLCQQESISYSFERVSFDTAVQEINKKTYYACARFIRLNQLIENQSFFAIDIDAVVRKNIPLLKEKDLYLHYVEKRPRFLAGGIFGSCNSKKFLNEYSVLLEKEIKKDNLYWGLDQDILKKLVPAYSWGALPKEYIDWEMKPDSFVWTAKGKRKELAIFTNEQQKYMS